jgi:hypothetical protein
MRLPGRLDYMLTPWRVIGRGLAAGDTLFFRGAVEQRAELMARLVARREGLSGDALARRVANLMGRTDAQRAAAEATALGEGLTGNDLARRVTDLLDRERPEDIRTTARQYGLRLTFNNEPYGVMGAIARGINKIAADVPPVRFIVPFTNIIANVVNEGLNWFPATGIARSVWGHWRGRLEGQEITNMEDLYDQHARAALGTVLVAGLYAAVAGAMDDEDPWIDITSLGPKDAGQRALEVESVGRRFVQRPRHAHRDGVAPRATQRAQHRRPPGGGENGRLERCAHQRQASDARLGAIEEEALGVVRD